MLAFAVRFSSFSRAKTLNHKVILPLACGTVLTVAAASLFAQEDASDTGVDNADFDGTAFDKATFDGAAFDGDVFDSEAFDNEAFDSAALDEGLFGEFADDFAPTENSSAPAWLSGFTVKVTHQLLLQTRSHEPSITTAAGQTLSFAKQADVETNRLAANIRYQYAFAPGWLLQASGFARLFIWDDYEFEAQGQDFAREYRLNEFFIQRSFGDHSLKLGNQTVVWGEVDGNSVLDVINMVDFRDFSTLDIEDIRMNQPMLVWEYFGDKFGERSRLSTFLTLYPEYNPPLMRGSPFYTEPAFHIADYKRTGNLDFEGGIRWSRSFEGSDIAVMAARLIENQLTYSAPAKPLDDAVSTNNSFSLLGFSANRAFGKMLLNVDLAYTRGVRINNINLPAGVGSGDSLQRRDQLGTSIGLEYAIDSEQNLAFSTQILQPLNKDVQNGEDSSAPDTDRTGIWLLRYSNSLLNGDLALALTAQGDLDAQFAILQASAERTLSDRWSAAVNLTLLEGVDTSPISLFEGDIRLGLTLSYSF